MDEFNDYEKSILNQISRFCANRERSTMDVLKKMNAIEISKIQQKKIIKWLIDNKFLDQERFENLYVKSKVNQKYWGRNKIKYGLHQNAIPGSGNFDKALSNIDNNQYFNNLKKILKTKRIELERKNADNIKAKLIRFAQSRGYTLDEIFNTLNETEQ